jgi:hypothetical protein
VPAPVKLGMAALVAFALFRRRSTSARATAARNDSPPPVRGPEFDGLALGEPVSPELALVDSSIRERLVAGNTSDAGTPETPALSPSASKDEVVARGGRRRGRQIVVGLTALVVAAVAATTIYTHRERSLTAPGAGPGRASPDGPSDGTRSSGRAFAWAPVANVSSYKVAILKNDKIVYSEATSVPRLTVPTHWRRGGRTLSLTPGTYEWYVWPVFRSGNTDRRGPPVVATTFSIG